MSLRTGAGGLHISDNRRWSVAVGTAIGAQPHKPRGGEGEGHWHPVFTVRAVGAQLRACARGHCPVPTGPGGRSGGAQTPEDAWSPGPGRSDRQGQGRESRSLETERTGRRPAVTRCR
jgi:hypothetical protein